MKQKIDKGTQRDRRSDMAGIRFIVVVILLASLPVLVPRIYNSVADKTIKPSTDTSANPCTGYKDCSYEVREYIEGAGWEIAGDVVYYGNGLHYAVGAKPMETGVKKIYYTMDCDCKPKDVKFK